MSRGFTYPVTVIAAYPSYFTGCCATIRICAYELVNVYYRLFGPSLRLPPSAVVFSDVSMLLVTFCP